MRKRHLDQSGNLLAIIAIGVVLVVIAGGYGLLQAKRQNRLNQQQSQFNVAQQRLTSFEQAVGKTFGKGHATIAQHNTCYYAEGTDFSKGRLWCAVEVEGAVDEIKPNNTNTTPAFATASQLNKLALKSLGVTTTANTSLGLGTGRPGDNVTGYLTYNPFGNTFTCNLNLAKPLNQDAVVQPKASQVFFALSCSQRADKQYYPMGSLAL